VVLTGWTSIQDCSNGGWHKRGISDCFLLAVILDWLVWSSLGGPSFLQRSTKLPGTGSEITDLSTLAFEAPCGIGGGGVLDASSVERVLSVCRDDLILGLLMRWAKRLSELCIVEDALKSGNMISWSLPGKNDLFEPCGTWL